ncbi:MAG: LytTR family transcriptional regulator [Lachnospiraceae bacterium]|nr:LytTR family transcriptional regulator [Lachnospiraceae bacterium]
MDIQIVEHKECNMQIIIKCKQIDNEVIRLKNHIELFDNKLSAKKDNELYFINSSDVLYFESVDNRTFLYTADDVMEINQRLYELENILSDKDFVRISKSQIVNINRIRSLKPELNRTILATMCNNEQLSISRKYVKTIRNILSI